MDIGAALAIDAADTWEDPPRRASASAAPVLAVDGFEGPLDWLLEMARVKKIDLARLSIAALIDSFAAAMEVTLARRDGGPMELARWATWIVMAATLTQLRSQLLLPADTPAAKLALSQAEALREQLVLRTQVAAATDWLERREQLGQDVFARGRPEVAASSGRVGDITELLRACLAVLRVPEELAAAYQPRPSPFWSMADATALMLRRLPELTGDADLVAFLPVVAREAPDRERRCKAAVASTLLAGLELARDGTVALDQEAAWMPIQVQRCEPADAATALVSAAM